MENQPDANDQPKAEDATPNESPQPTIKHAHKFIFAYLALIVIVAAIAWVYALHKHNQASGKSSTSTNQVSSAAIPSAKRYWIMGAKVIDEMSANSSAYQAIANDVIFVIMNGTSKLASSTAGLHIIRTADYTSEAKLASDIKSHSIPSGTQAILYDNEPWSYTPANEQQNPQQYYQTAANLAHAQQLWFVATPVSKLDPQIDEQVASFSDVLDIQSQFDQATASGYSGHVLPIAKSARQNNVKLIILSGLSTNPRAGIPTPAQLVADANAVYGPVEGYWLNIPNTPSVCNTMPSSSKSGRCAGPQPQIGISFLGELGPAK